MSVRLVFFLKPEAVVRRYTGARTLKRLIEEIPNIKFLCFEELKPDKDFLSDKHYAEHKGKFFFNWLLDYVSLGPILFSIIETDKDNVKRIRELLGPTIPEKAAKEAPTTIRAMYGIAGGVNIAHASDAIETANRETSIWAEYLKDKHGIDIDNVDPQKVMDRVWKYIQKYIDYPMVDSIRYREIIFDVINGKINKDEAVEKISELLSKETDDKFKDPEYLKTLARLIIESALLRK